MPPDTRAGRRPGSTPRFPAVGRELPADLRRETLTEIRRFCAGEPGAGSSLAKIDGSWLPAALYPYRHHELIRQDYPLFLVAEPGAPARCAAVSDLLAELVESFGAGPDDARTLKDNLARLEIEVRKAMDSGDDRPRNAAEVLADASASLEALLALRGDGARTLHDDLGRLLAALPPGGVFMTMSEDTAVQMLLKLGSAAAAERAGLLREKASRLRRRLRDHLTVERAKGGLGRGPEALSSAVGAAGLAHIDTGSLSKVMGKVRGTDPADPSRAHRLEQVIGVLDTFLAAQDRPMVHLVGAGRAPDWLAGEPVAWHACATDPCADAAALFDSVAAEHVPLFAAMRTASLELEGLYDAARHGTLAATLDWRFFPSDELLLLPPVLAVETSEDLAGPAQLSLSRLMLSGRPVGVLVHVPVAGDPGADPMQRYRLELAYLGIGHREALVNQSTAARPSHLLAGFARSLLATHTSLHVVTSSLTASGQEPLLGSWLHGGAALEGRAHPLFHYDPEAGETWAKRLDFSMNPSPTEDWSSYEVACLDAAGQPTGLSGQFTFADFSVLEDAYLEQFRVVPDDLKSDSLVEAAVFLRLDAGASFDKTPYIWATDGDGVLHRLVFTRRLTFACRDRLDYWRTLQELAGVRNEHVREAVQAERRRLESEFVAEREALAAEHAAEIERVRREAAGEALQRLAAALVNTDLASLSASAVVAPAAAVREAPAPTTGPVEPAPTTPAPPAEEESVGFDEPYIDSALCTSCNDCTNLNPRLFVYNANKQAVIGDPKAGTFAELVAAAEKCPARCIHPGKPLNPGEPNLAELTARAKAFN